VIRPPATVSASSIFGFRIHSPSILANADGLR
jgi:hypothetical protein